MSEPSVELERFAVAGKVAVVTGAASGIGRGIARSLARAGARLVLADIDEDALDDALADVRRLGADAVAIGADVSSQDSVSAVAALAEQRFGRLHIAVNNAGVALHGVALADAPLNVWRWIVDVNVFGVIHGVRAFLPVIARHGEGGHIVNTASGSGMFIRAGRRQGAYAMTKYAVVALSEALEIEAGELGVGVSVLCPGAVRSNFHESSRRRPDRYGGPYEEPRQAFLAELTAQGLDPDAVGDLVADAIVTRRFYVFTHSSLRDPIEARHARILASFEGVPDRPAPHDTRRATGGE